MKISNSAALVLASSATLLASQSPAFAFTPTAVSAHPSVQTAATLKMAKEEASDGGRTKIDEEQIKRMNYQFRRGPGGANGTPHANPLMDIQSYIPVAEPALTRKNIQDSTCIVSGSSNRVTPELFYLLNSEDSAFKFNRIVSLSQDVSKTKKRLLTRTARYTGLLSKLAYEEGSVVPPPPVLEEASNWIALVDTPEELKALIPSAAQVDNLSILFFYTPEAESQLDSLSAELMAANPSASLVLVPQASVEEDPNEDPLEADFKPTPIIYYYEKGKGEPLKTASTATATGTTEGEPDSDKKTVSIEPSLVHNPEFTLEEARRLAVECLQLQAGAGKTIMLQCMEKKGALEMMQLVKQDEPSTQNLFTKLILGLREAGYERPQEIAYMLDKGVDHMKEAIQKFGLANPGAVKALKSGGSSWAKEGEAAVITTNAWWEDPEFQKLVKQSSLRKGEEVTVTTTPETAETTPEAGNEETTTDVVETM